MTRPTSAALAAALALAGGLCWAQAPEGGDAALEPLRASFAGHRIGEPYLDAAASSLRSLVCAAGGEACDGLARTLARARDVQEGCVLPCDAPADAAVYREKVSLVCGDLGMAETACAKARDNFIVDGVPRKKTSAAGQSPWGAELDSEARSMLKARFDPALRQRLGDRARRMAQALGRHLSEVAEGSELSAPGPRARKAAAPPKAVKPAPAAPAALSLEEVNRRLNESLDAELSKLPAGRDILRRATPRPKVSIASLEEGTMAHFQEDGNKIEFNAEFVGEILERFSSIPVEGETDDPEALAAHLGKHPEVIALLAGHMDTTYVHELTHAVQFAKGGSGLIGKAVDWAREKVNGQKYPVEYELEAFGSEHAYFHQKVKADPSFLSPDKTRPETLADYQEYIADLSEYRRAKTALYQEECSSIKNLWFYGWERGHFGASMAAETRAWPRMSYEGSMLLAGRKAGDAFPALALDHLGRAYDRAAKNGFLAQAKPEMTRLFLQATVRFEAALTKPGAYSFGDDQKKLLKRLSADLGVTLPPRTSRAAGVEPAPVSPAGQRKEAR